jgi:MerR family Zn(II)-responsive transcriptional regulator of zntA
MQGLTIGKLAEITGVSADTLRYYEKMKLIRADRTGSGYRVYDADAEGVIRFILGAKALNFTLEEIRSLLSLKASDQTSCVEVLKKNRSQNH